MYFRTDAARGRDAAATLHRLVDAVARRTGVRGRVLRKRDEPHLWMEVYEGVTDVEAFEAALARAADELGVERLLVPGSSRHVERFVAA